MLNVIAIVFIYKPNEFAQAREAAEIIAAIFIKRE